MSPSVPSVAAWLSSVGLLIGLLAGCGADPVPRVPGPVPPPREHFTRVTDLERAVAARVQADRTASTSTSGTVPGPSGGSAPLPEGDGAIEFGPAGTAARAFLPMVFDPASGADPALLEAVVKTDDTAWVRAPAGFGRPGEAGKPWFGPIQLGETFAGTAEQRLAVLATRAVRTAEPTRAWSADLYGAGVTLVDSADEDLDGVPAVRYRIAVDIARAADSQRDPRRKRTLQQYLREGETTNEITVWVDAEHRPLRVEQRVGTRDRPATVDVRYREWGRPVSIAAPPAAQTTR